MKLCFGLLTTALFTSGLVSSAAIDQQILSAGIHQAPLVIQPNSEIIPNEFIVVLRQDSQEKVEQAIDQLLMAEHIDQSQLLHRYSIGFAARLEQGQLDLLRSHQEIDYIEPNQVVYALEAASEQDNPPSWGLPRIHQREFRSRSVYRYPVSGGANVDAYVIDTGIYVDHKDFEGRAKWGFTAPRGDTDTDGNGHGTHVASTIAGKQYGVAKKATVIAVKVLSSSGYGTMADVVAGVEWAAKSAKQSGRKSVANMSLGGGRSLALDAVMKKAIASGLAFAVAAGNSNMDACQSSPAAVEEAVTVGASTEHDDRAYFSNFGKCVDIFGPGHYITGAWIGGATKERIISGTSMASPHVCGVMALLLADADYTPTQLTAKLLELATKDALTGVPADTVNLLLNNGV